LTGEWIGLTLAVILLAILVYVMVWLWWKHRADAVDDPKLGGAEPGRAGRLEELPAGLRPETNDPWSEAIRRRAEGDYAGAIVCLFAHQLLSLDRLGLIRLVPGRTARQLVRAVDDPRFRDSVIPTLRMFEAVYYGHLPPSAEEFECVWALAETFEDLVAARIGS
jgi:hypothetical protein